MIRFASVPYIAGFVILLIAGCKTPDDKNETKVETKPNGASVLQETIDRKPEEMVAAIEKLRDRSFKKPPTWKAREGELHQASQPLPDRIASERHTLNRVLFNLDDQNPEGLASHLERVADYDADSHTIVFRRDYPSQGTLEVAVVVALVEALDAQHFDARPAATSWDEYLGKFAGLQADQLLVAAAYLAAERVDETGLTLDQIAKRPELSLELAPLADHLGRDRPDKGEVVQSGGELRNRLTAFTQREGLALGAALYRSNGWSGVELLTSFQPESTADAVRPDRWMAGEGLGHCDWSKDSWPDEHELESEGRVGPGIIAIWLGQKFRPQLARTVYSGWRSDNYRFGKPGADSDASSSGWRFEWVSQWDTPTSARQIARAFEKILALEYDAPASGSHTYQVVRTGLKVGVLVRKTSGASDESKSRESSSNDTGFVSSCRVKYEPRRKLPTSFIPTRSEAFRVAATRAELDGMTWSDPASGLSTNLSPVSDWKTRLSRTLPLRWFAKDGDVLLQMTTELDNPLDAAFGTDDYLAALEDSFTGSFADADFENHGAQTRPFEQTLRFSVSGKKGEREWLLEAWQFEHGDVIATLSLQGPKSQVEKRLETTERIIESIEKTGTTPGDERKRSKSKGTIEYEIEEE